MKEVWKDAVGYEGLYQVSNLGKIKSLARKKGCVYCKERILTLTDTPYGYTQVSMSKNGKNKTIRTHIIVAKTFLENPNNYPIINHKDENKKNNRVDNLEWCNHKYNCNYGTAKFRSGIKRRIPILCVELDRVFDSAVTAEKEIGVSKKHICSCCTGKRQRTGGYHWKYAE